MKISKALAVFFGGGEQNIRIGTSEKEQKHVIIAIPLKQKHSFSTKIQIT